MPFTDWFQRSRVTKPVWGRGKVHSNTGLVGQLPLSSPHILGFLSSHLRVPTGRVLFEIAGEPGGAELRPELAREALRLAADKLPVIVDFIDKSTPHRLGNLDIHRPPQLGGASSPDGVTTPTLPTKSNPTRYLVGGANNLRVLGVQKRPDVESAESSV